MNKDLRYLINFILIVITVWIVFGYVLPSIEGGGGGGGARVVPEQLDLVRLKASLEMFQFDCGRFPTTKEGLAALMKLPPAVDAAHWRGPYWWKDGLPMDSWGRPYAYNCPGIHNTNGYDVYSLGPNGKGGDEAIGNWKPVISQK